MNRSAFNSCRKNESGLVLTACVCVRLYMLFPLSCAKTSNS